MLKRLVVTCLVLVAAGTAARSQSLDKSELAPAFELTTLSVQQFIDVQNEPEAGSG